jgi:hypothetical protein
MPLPEFWGISPMLFPAHLLASGPVPRGLWPGQNQAGCPAVTRVRRPPAPGNAGPVIPPGPVKQARCAGTEVGQLHRARGDRRSTIRRDSPPARQMPGNHDCQRHENHDHCQPPGRLAFPPWLRTSSIISHRLEQPMPARGRYVGQPAGTATGHHHSACPGLSPLLPGTAGRRDCRHRLKGVGNGHGGASFAADIRSRTRSRWA